MCPHINIILPTYAVMALVGLFISLVFMLFRIEKIPIEFNDFLKLLILCVVFGLIGSRIAFFISRVPWLINNFSISNVLSVTIGGGFVYFGGLFGVLYGCKLFSKKMNLDTNNLYNMIVPAIPLFHVFGRIGCFFAGCCYGLTLLHPINLFDVLIINRIPTQLIEVVFETVIFVVILFLEKKFDKIDSLKVYLISYAIFRFILEFFRGDDIRGLLYGVSTSQFISIGILVFYIFKYIMRKSADDTRFACFGFLKKR